MPSTTLRKQVLAAARRVVVKLGTQLLTDGQGRLDRAYLRRVARQIVRLRDRGMEVTLVSSGAVGAGMAELSLTARPTDVADLQAVAAVGQPRLMHEMTHAFASHRVHTSQLLLTYSDFEDRTRFLNMRNCLAHLHRHGCIPIINENDTVAVDELRFGDNDMLAALIANAVRADALVLMTTVDGVLDPQGVKLDMIQNIDDVLGMVRKDKSRLGTGGMGGKLDAVRRVVSAGEVAVIVNGRARNVLPRLFGGSPGLGSVFVPADRRLDARRRWIGLTKRSMGSVTVDAGAARALTDQGKSLLAIGITRVAGQFARGDVLSVCGPDGVEIARGMTNYAADELSQIKGKKSSQFEKILGRASFAEVIHRDNLVRTGT